MDMTELKAMGRRTLGYFRQNARDNLRLGPPSLEAEHRVVWVATACAAGDIALLVAVSQTDESERGGAWLSAAVEFAAAALPLAVFAVYLVRMNPGTTSLKIWAWVLTSLASLIASILTGLAFWNFVGWFGPDARRAFAATSGICALIAGMTMYAAWRVGPPAREDTEHEQGDACVPAEDDQTEAEASEVHSGSSTSDDELSR